MTNPDPDPRSSRATDCPARPDHPVIERIAARTSTLGQGLTIRRALPSRQRRMIGAWCFFDHAGPMSYEAGQGVAVGPHPHIGLQTFSWLIEGRIRHTDSLGNEVWLEPGQVNLMTAGHGIAHAELAAQPPFRGVQMWIAQPEATRHGGSDFVHHAELPQTETGGLRGLVFAGSLAGATAPTRTDTPLVGADLVLDRGATSLATDVGFEHCVVPLDGRVKVGQEVLEPGWLGLIPTGVEELPIAAETDATRFLVLGGTPLGERVSMWWNFVARDQGEITAAYRDWQARTDRFGEVPSSLTRIEAPRPPWLPPEDR